jgi:hypothetical protein
MPACFSEQGGSHRRGSASARQTNGEITMTNTRPDNRWPDGRTLTEREYWERCDMMGIFRAKQVRREPMTVCQLWLAAGAPADNPPVYWNPNNVGRGLVPCAVIYPDGIPQVSEYIGPLDRAPLLKLDNVQNLSHFQE